MKKNMLAILILILTVVNLTLLAFIVFTVVPNARKTDKLITSVLSAIDLELESPLPDDEDANKHTYDITKVEKFEFEEMNANLKKGLDGKPHIAIISASLTIDTKHDDYKKLKDQVEVMKSDLKAIIINNFKKYTLDDLSDPEANNIIKEDILLEIQNLFNSTFIVDCTLSYLTQ